MPAIVSKLLKKRKPDDTVERCGLVLTRNRLVELENQHETPENGFMIPAADLVAHEDELVGTWHTHVNANGALSQEDYFGFAQWPSLTHYIIGFDGVRAYRVKDTGFIEEISLEAL